MLRNIIMGEKNASYSADTMKWWYSFYSAVIFFIIASPMTYKLVNSLLGSIVKICDPKGCPTAAGLFVHSTVFLLVVRAMM